VSFTTADVERLQRFYNAAAPDRGWRRAQFVANGFSQYFAIWESAAEPALAVIRFAASGSYALLARGRITITAPSLDAILPAALVQPRPDEGGLAEALL
jgi:hypothetical protein